MLELCYYLKEFLIDLLFPRDLTCVLCNRELFDVSEGNFCNVCMGSIQFTAGNSCTCCGRNIPSSNIYGVCLNCSLLTRHYDSGVAVLKYDDYSKKLFFDLKYFNKKFIAHTMAVYIKKKLVGLNLEHDIDYFVPVPLHINKFKKRGYNQSYIICKYLSELTGIQTLECIDRIKDTRPLNGLDPEERQVLLHDAFVIKENFSLDNKIIVLVDDIFTTGSTINACSEVLKNENVKYIVSACFGIGE